VVSEKRKKGLKYLEKRTDRAMVLLDDAMQHRKVICQANLLLTDHQLLYTQDHMMPTGRLREWAVGAKRAQIILVTKCPEDLSLQAAQDIQAQLNVLPQQKVFFTALTLGNPKKLKGALSLDKRPYQSVLALSGLANPSSFHVFCQRFSDNIQYKTYRDHHQYSIKDMQEVFNQLDPNTIVLCTEKDAIKLKEEHLLAFIPENTVYVLPVFVAVLFDQEQALLTAIESCLND
jgi:tetraacyldisaccharide 4'-kinase